MVKDKAVTKIWSKNDIEMKLAITPTEARDGCGRTIRVERHVSDGACNGTGIEPGTGGGWCATCGGSGQISKTSRTPYGITQEISRCVKCGGRGKIIGNKCKACAGAGKITLNEDIHIVIPPGSSPDGVVIRVEGKGHVDNPGDRPGDVLVVVTVQR